MKDESRDSLSPLVAPGAFDALAADYDATFTHSPLGLMLRRRVWRVLADYFHPGQKVLELACGTGEDALWLARRGIAVTATDGSAAMARITAGKVHQANLSRLVTPVQRSLQEIIQGTPEDSYAYNGAFSNFGGLNTLADWRPLASALAQRVKPGGHVVLVPMGPVCPWEIGWHGLRGEWRTATRRFHQPATARIGETQIPIWYPSVARLRRDFAPWFECARVESLGLWLPPSALGHWVERRPRLFAILDRLERSTARLGGGWGDHFVMVLRRG